MFKDQQIQYSIFWIYGQEFWVNAIYFAVLSQKEVIFIQIICVYQCIQIITYPQKSGLFHILIPIV